MNEPIDLPPEVTTVDLYIGDRFYQRMSRELFEEELEFARAVGPTLNAMLRQGLEYFEDRHPLAASSSVAPNQAGTEEQRVTRELVPLVRQAAADTPVGVVPRLDPDLARLRVYWPQGKPFPQPALADWVNKPVTWPSIVGWYRDQERNQHDVDCGCPTHSWWLP